MLYPFKLHTKGLLIFQQSKLSSFICIKYTVIIKHVQYSIKSILHINEFLIKNAFNETSFDNGGSWLQLYYKLTQFEQLHFCDKRTFLFEHYSTENGHQKSRYLAHQILFDTLWWGKYKLIDKMHQKYCVH